MSEELQQTYQDAETLINSLDDFVPIQEGDPVAHTHLNLDALDGVNINHLHDHPNLGLLNWITEDKLHTHFNFELLQGIAPDNIHTHSNLELLQGITPNNIHSHSNFELLEGITSDNIHTHSNLELLQGIAPEQLRVFPNWEILLKLSEIDGKLAYNGAIVGVAPTPTPTPTPSEPFTPKHRYVAQLAQVDSTGGINSATTVPDSGTGNKPLLQATKANQPLLVVDNGQALRMPINEVRFMTTASLGLTNTYELIAVAAYKSTTVGDSNELFSFSGGVGGMLGISGAQWRIGRSGVAWDISGGAVSTNPQLIGIRWTGNNHILRVNGIDVATSSAAPLFSGVFELNFAGGALAEFLCWEVWIDNLLTDQQRQALETFLRNRYSLS